VIAHSLGVTAAFLALRQVLTAGRLVAVAGVSDFRFLADEFCRRLRLSPRLRQDVLRRIEEELFPDTAGLWELFDAKQRTGEITLPILVIHDQDDATAPISQAHLLKAAYGDQLTLITTTKLGHSRILADPAVIGSALAFLRAPAPQRTQA
jgi:pimeloyl-ACP methyl ester carboxylesterase